MRWCETSYEEVQETVKWCETLCGCETLSDGAGHKQMVRDTMWVCETLSDGETLL